MNNIWWLIVLIFGFGLIRYLIFSLNPSNRTTQNQNGVESSKSDVTPFEKLLQANGITIDAPMESTRQTKIEVSIKYLGYIFSNLQYCITMNNYIRLGSSTDLLPTITTRHIPSKFIIKHNNIFYMAKWDWKYYDNTTKTAYSTYNTSINDIINYDNLLIGSELIHAVYLYGEKTPLLDDKLQSRFISEFIVLFGLATKHHGGPSMVDKYHPYIDVDTILNGVIHD